MGNRSVEEILREILAENRALLRDRNALTGRMDHAVPARLAREYIPVRKAIYEAGIGETIFSAGTPLQQEEARQSAIRCLIGYGVPEDRAATILAVLFGAAQPQAPLDAPPEVVSVQPTPIPMPVQSMPPQAPSAMAGTWICQCGREGNDGNFCAACGRPRPTANSAADGSWQCPNCATVNNDGSFCASCGQQRNVPVAAPSRREVLQRSAASMAVPVAMAGGAMTQAPAYAQPMQGTGTMPPPQSQSDWNAQVSSAKQRLNDEIFTTEGRLNRWPYFTKGLLLNVGGGLIAAIAAIIPLIGPFIAVGISIGMIVGAWMLITRRLHDLNKSGWYGLLLFVPIVDIFVGLCLLFMKGTDGPNEYGPDPLQL